MKGIRIADLTGLWRRSLIARPGGSRDTTSWVRWLQGPTDYADLRQPASRPDFTGVACLRQLGPAHLDWLATQEGFSGELSVSSGIFEWRRDIDFAPPPPTPDRGRLTRDGDILVEDGYFEPYVEHWHVESQQLVPTYALRLRDRTGGRARIVRVGGLFMFARARSAPLPAAPDLTTCIAAAGSSVQAQDMMDCEISFGTVAERDWTIIRSTLPFKEGRSLGVRLSTALDRIKMSDLTPDGCEIIREWKIAATQV